MDKLTTKQIIELYKMMGLKSPKFCGESAVVNLFEILNIEPVYDIDGNRILTPYEMLGILPKFIQEEEVPIVFAIKNPIEKIGKTDSIGTKFTYKNAKTKDDKTVLQNLKQSYREALLAGDEVSADSYLKIIESISSNEARRLKQSFYDYSKFYRKMKRQLLIDLFAHFFLLYIQKRSKLIKYGILKKDKLYKAYREEYLDYAQETIIASDIGMLNGCKNQVNVLTNNLQNIQRIVINDREVGEIEFQFDKNDIKVKKNSNIDNNLQNNSENKLAYQVEERKVLDKVDNLLDLNVEVPKVEDNNQDKKTGKFRGIIKSIINKKNKQYRRMGVISQNVNDEEQEEKAPYSKVEKIKEREIDI